MHAPVDWRVKNADATTDIPLVVKCGRQEVFPHDVGFVWPLLTAREQIKGLDSPRSDAVHGSLDYDCWMRIPGSSVLIKYTFMLYIGDYCCSRTVYINAFGHRPNT